MRPNRQSRSICFDSLRSPFQGRPAVDPSPLRSVETAPAPRRVHSPKWRRTVVLPHKPHGSNRLPTDHRAPRFCSPRKVGGVERSCALPHTRGTDPLQTVAGASAGSPRCALSSPKISAAGFAPASIRLEGGGLSFSATRIKWTSRRDSHPQHGVRSAA